jgi:hypothetical protein
MPQYYVLDRTKLSVRDVWRTSRSMRSFFAGLLTKWRIAGKTRGAPIVRAEGIRRLTFEEFPPEARADLEIVRDEIIAAGLLPQFYYQVIPENALQPDDIARGVVFQSSDRLTVGMLAWTRIARTAEFLKQSVTVVRKHSPFQCLSWLSDGHVLVTTNNRRSFDWPANVQTEQDVGAPSGQIVAMHLRRLSAVSRDNVVVTSGVEVEGAIVQLMQARLDILIERGLYAEVGRGSGE